MLMPHPTLYKGEGFKILLYSPTLGRFRGEFISFNNTEYKTVWILIPDSYILTLILHVLDSCLLHLDS